MRTSKPEGKHQVFIKVEIFLDLYGIKFCSKSRQTNSWPKKGEMLNFMKST